MSELLPILIRRPTCQAWAAVRVPAGVVESWVESWVKFGVQ